jgi:hypothetical protein
MQPSACYQSLSMTNYMRQYCWHGQPMGPVGRSPALSPRPLLQLFISTILFGIQLLSLGV